MRVLVYLLCVLMATATATAGVANDYIETLQTRQIETTQSGIRAFLKTLNPNDESQRRRTERIASLIQQLGDGQFSV